MKEAILPKLTWVSIIPPETRIIYRFVFIIATSMLIYCFLFSLNLYSFIDLLNSVMMTAQVSYYQNVTTYLTIFYPITILLSLISLFSSSIDLKTKQHYNFFINFVIALRIAAYSFNIIDTVSTRLTPGIEQIATNLYGEKITFVTYMLYTGLGLLGLLTLTSPFLATTRLKNAQQIKADMQNRVSLVNSKLIPRLDVDDKVIVYCDLVGTSSLLTFRNLTILSSIVPGLLNVFLSETTLDIDMCLGQVYYAYEAANVTLCKLDFEYQGISLETSIFGSSYVSFPILIIIAFYLYSMIRTILLLHKYRAKFFAVGLKFSDQFGLFQIFKDILWNAVIVYILFFIILDMVQPNMIDTISQLSSKPIPYQGNTIMAPVIKNLLNSTDSAGNIYSEFAVNFSNSVNPFGPISYIALLGSLYGLMFHSKSSALLSFFRERDLVALGMVSTIKIKFEVPNFDNKTLEFVRMVYLWFPNETARTKLTVLLSFFKDTGELTMSTLDINTWDPNAYFRMKESKMEYKVLVKTDSITIN